MRDAQMTSGIAGLSIVIPCFDAEQTLGAAIESVLAQEKVDLDVVVVGDGSSDNSFSLASEYHPRVRVLTGPNRGVSTARNRGIGESSKEWIVFLDADDLLTPGTLIQRLHTAAKTEANIVICDWQELVETSHGYVDGSVRRVDRDAIEADAEIACATNVWAPTAALMYRRSLVDRIGGFQADLPVIQDARFLFDAACLGAHFAHSPHVGACYRVSDQSLSRSDPGRFWRDVLTNGIQIEALWRSRGEPSSNQRDALAGIYNQAGRGLFAAGHPDYFKAVECQRTLGGQLPLHPRIAAPLARALGLRATRQVLALTGF